MIRDNINEQVCCCRPGSPSQSCSSASHHVHAPCSSLASVTTKSVECSSNAKCIDIEGRGRIPRDALEEMLPAPAVCVAVSLDLPVLLEEISPFPPEYLSKIWTSITSLFRVKRRDKRHPPKNKKIISIERYSQYFCQHEPYTAQTHGPFPCCADRRPNLAFNLHRRTYPCARIP